MKYLNALLRDRKNSSHTSQEEPTKPTELQPGEGQKSEYPKEDRATKPTKPVLSVLSCPSSGGTGEKNDRYRQGASTLSEDCFTIDPIWLAEKHPELWLRMALIDHQLAKIEQRRAEQSEYESMLEQLVQTVKKARALYEQESQRNRRGAVQ